MFYEHSDTIILLYCSNHFEIKKKLSNFSPVPVEFLDKNFVSEKGIFMASFFMFIFEP